MRKAVSIAVAAALGVTATSNHAVVLNPHGTGQVLLYPYYTVNAGNGTLLSIVNSTAAGKALKVHVREGYNGRDVLIFNLYLSPFDVWVAQIFDGSSDGTGGAAIATNDNSCTVPAFSETFGPAPWQGPRGASFRDAGYTGANADGGPTVLSHTREGYVEIIEMGELTNDEQTTLAAITHTSAGVPANCPKVVGGWSAGGYWTTHPETDLSPPGGGLYGAESIINVGEGTMYTVNAEAIDGFSTAIQHSAPGNATPDLSAASKSDDGMASAFVPVGPGMVEVKYEHPEDAISALFMADAIYNEYVVDPGVGAMTDWVVTFPTKRFYTDPALVGAAARPPFDAVFGTDAAVPGTSCSGVALQYFSREELTTTYGAFFLHPASGRMGSCYATSVLTFGTPLSALYSGFVRSVDDGYWSVLPVDQVGFTAGHGALDFLRDTDYEAQTNHALASANGIVLHGLPAIGFAATNYVNANVSPGTLANYSGANPHRSAITCTATAPAACP